MKFTLFAKKKQKFDAQRDQVMRLGKGQLEKLAKKGMPIQFVVSA